MATCPRCGGNGTVRCGHCDGHGWFTGLPGNLGPKHACSHCNESGEMTCPNCGGAGEIETD